MAEAELARMASTEALRGKLSQAIGRARYAGVRTVLTVRGEPAAALVPLADLPAADLERLECFASRTILKGVPVEQSSTTSIAGEGSDR